MFLALHAGTRNKQSWDLLAALSLIRSSCKTERKTIETRISEVGEIVQNTFFFFLNVFFFLCAWKENKEESPNTKPQKEQKECSAFWPLRCIQYRAVRLKAQLSLLSASGIVFHFIRTGAGGSWWQAVFTQNKSCRQAEPLVENSWKRNPKL